LHKLILLEIVVFFIIGLWYFNRINDIEDSASRETLIGVAGSIENYFLNILAVGENTLLQEGKLIASLDRPTRQQIYEIITDFETNKFMKEIVGWSALSWLDPDSNKIYVDSSLGVLETPIEIDLSKREHLKLAQSRHNSIFIGLPIIGSVSGQPRIPFSIALEDNTGKHIGTLLGGFDVEKLNSNIVSTYKYNTIMNYTIFSKTGDIIISSSDSNFSKQTLAEISSAIASQTHNTFVGDKTIFYSKHNSVLHDKNRIIKRIGHLPFYILVSLDKPSFSQNTLDTIWRSTFDISIILLSTVLITVFVRITLLKPIIELSKNAKEILSDNPKINFKDYSSRELIVLSDILKRVVEQKFALSEANKQLEFLANKAQVASNAKSDFLRNLQHEFRTPLNHILGAAEIILSQSSTNSKNKEYIDMILLSGQELLASINQVIELSDYETGKVTLNEIEVSIDHIVDEALSETYSKLNIKKVSVQRTIPSKLPKIKVDGDKITKALVSVLDNCIKFSNKTNPEIKISAALDLDRLTISISDNGIGIKEQDLEKITDSFQSSGNVLTKYHRGLGIGLTIVKSVLELHDADLSITSKEDEGTVVKITFPKYRVLS
jgi:signal transduction histidine kinase